MEVSVIGSSQVKFGRTIEVGFCSFSNNLNAKIWKLKNGQSKGWNFGQNLMMPSKSCMGVTLKASANPHIQAALVSDKASTSTKSKHSDNTALFVGLPLDTVSDCGTVKHARAIAAGLQALKLLGVEGVELPVWWGVAENEAMGKYNWRGYLTVVELVKKLGLNLHVSLCFHASQEAQISLPQWVSKIGESEPSIYFTDRTGHQFKECLSLAADELPILEGKTPLNVYEEFCESFKSTFLPYMGSTIKGVSIGLGPDGELRYPSLQHSKKNNGVGEFQCYDKNMLNNLKSHAEKHGNPLWGLGGPHDAPTSDQSPISGGFFTENGGSWESTYGDFFLSWYSSELIGHGDRMLSLATEIFKDTPITLSGKVPLMHSWCKARSRPSELTAGYYSTEARDGYEAITQIFSRNSCKIILPGMDLSDDDQPEKLYSSPESLLAEILMSCGKHGVEVSGQNSLISGSSKGFEQIRKKLVGEDAVVELFTYQRMGAALFSPDNFPLFTQFVRGLNQPLQSADDLPMEEQEGAESLSGADVQMQTA